MNNVRTEAKSDHPNRGARRRVKLLVFALLAFMSWAGLILWNQQGKLDVKAAQVEQLEAKRQETARLNEEYKREMSRLNDPEYILQKIRKEYHYARPGETLFFIPKPQP